MNFIFAQRCAVPGPTLANIPPMGPHSDCIWAHICICAIIHVYYYVICMCIDINIYIDMYISAVMMMMGHGDMVFANLDLYVDLCLSYTKALVHN